MLFVVHGLYLKGLVFGLANTAKFFVSLGLPGWFGWVAPFLSLHLLAVAIVAHWGNGWLFTNKGGGYEFPLFWAIVCAALALTGGGAASARPESSTATR